MNTKRSAGFTLTEACAAIGFPDNNVRSWIKRGVIDLPARPEGVGWRRLDIPDVLMLAVAVRLSTYCVPVAQAWQAAEEVDGSRFRLLRTYKNTPDRAYVSALLNWLLAVWHDELGWQWRLHARTPAVDPPDFPMRSGVLFLDLPAMAAFVVERLDA